jgi:hypothetical protein
MGAELAEHLEEAGYNVLGVDTAVLEMPQFLN